MLKTKKQYREKTDNIDPEVIGVWNPTEKTVSHCNSRKRDFKSSCPGSNGLHNSKYRKVTPRESCCVPACQLFVSSSSTFAICATQSCTRVPPLHLLARGSVHPCQDTSSRKGYRRTVWTSVEEVLWQPGSTLHHGAPDMMLRKPLLAQAQKIQSSGMLQ